MDGRDLFSVFIWRLSSCVKLCNGKTVAMESHWGHFRGIPGRDGRCGHDGWHDEGVERSGENSARVCLWNDRLFYLCADGAIFLAIDAQLVGKFYFWLNFLVC